MHRIRGDAKDGIDSSQRQPFLPEGQPQPLRSRDPQRSRQTNFREETEARSNPQGPSLPVSIPDRGMVQGTIEEMMADGGRGAQQQQHDDGYGGGPVNTPNDIVAIVRRA